MGYALGRIEAAPINQLPFEPMQPPRYIGHVASIAVYNHYRGNGIGTALITKLHEEFGQTFQLDEVSLYCRVSIFIGNIFRFCQLISPCVLGIQRCCVDDVQQVI